MVKIDINDIIKEAIEFECCPYCGSQDLIGGGHKRTNSNFLSLRSQDWLMIITLYFTTSAVVSPILVTSEGIIIGHALIKSPCTGESSGPTIS